MKYFFLFLLFSVSLSVFSGLSFLFFNKTGTTVVRKIKMMKNNTKMCLNQKISSIPSIPPSRTNFISSRYHNPVRIFCLKPHNRFRNRETLWRSVQVLVSCPDEKIDKVTRFFIQCLSLWKPPRRLSDHERFKSS